MTDIAPASSINTQVTSGGQSAPAVSLHYYDPTCTSSYGGTGCARPVDPTHPLPATDANNAPFSAATPMTPGGSAITAGRSVAIIATAAGNVSLQLPSGALIVPVSVGLNILPFAATAINTSGTTATATYFNLN